jgi:hypothetical protein
MQRANRRTGGLARPGLTGTDGSGTGSGSG